MKNTVPYATKSPTNLLNFSEILTKLHNKNTE